MSLLIPLVAALTAPLADPKAEARAQALEREIRCVVCENEPISQSTAGIAGDMRGLVRERIAAGDSDDEIRDYFAQRYGDFVLLRPRTDGTMALLWVAPALLAALGLALALHVRRGNAQAAPSDQEPDDR